MRKHLGAEDSTVAFSIPRPQRARRESGFRNLVRPVIVGAVVFTKECSHRQPTAQQGERGSKYPSLTLPTPDLLLGLLFIASNRKLEGQRAQPEQSIKVNLPGHRTGWRKAEWIQGTKGKYPPELDRKPHSPPQNNKSPCTHLQCTHFLPSCVIL